MRRRQAAALAVLVGLASGAACDNKRLPTAPSDLATGIVIYEHANFQGQSAHITTDIADLRDVRGPCEHYETGGTAGSGYYYYDWNDCISSVRVAPGWRATLYRDDHYRDDALDITEDVPNLQLVTQHDCPHDGLNDCVTSIRVRPQ
ncbi:MAG: peptidase inhibitor family I36 protein [Vicinamibacterales bacterium]